IGNRQVDIKYIKEINYRPFDNGFMYYLESMNTEEYGIPIPKSYRSRFKVMRNMGFENTALIIGRQGQVVGDMPWNLSFIAKTIVDLNMFYRGGGMVFPLYVYPETNGQQTIEQSEERTPNLNPEILAEIEKSLGLSFVPEKDRGNLCFANNTSELRDDYKQTFAPIDILDYIYAVLHSPSYREKYKEFLKIDFPRVPYPTDKDTFWKLVALGGEIRSLHLLESPKVEQYITQYPIDGDNVVGKPKYIHGKVYINEIQYFD